MTEYSRRAVRAFIAGLAVTVLAGCSVSKEPPKVPLAGGSTAAQAGDTANPHADRLSPAARKAIDLANAQFRAGKYDEALKSYREAAAASPDNSAAYFGIYMVAQKKGDKALADSALKIISSTSGLNDSTVRDVHANSKVPAPPKKS